MRYLKIALPLILIIIIAGLFYHTEAQSQPRALADADECADYVSGYGQLVEALNLGDEESLFDDPLWNLCRDEVDKIILVHGFLPGCGTEYWGGLDTWLEEAYEKPVLYYIWCMAEPSIAEVDRMIDYLEDECTGEDECVIISHSTGGLYTSVALGKIYEDDVELNITGHIALSSAQGGLISENTFFADSCRALVPESDLSGEDFAVCEALLLAREGIDYSDTQWDLTNWHRWKNLGVTHYQHRYVVSKFLDRNTDGVLPTHSICGVTDTRTEFVCDNPEGCLRDACSDFLSASPEEPNEAVSYLGNEQSSYEYYLCDPDGFMLGTCHGYITRNENNVACEVFRGYNTERVCNED